MLGVVETTDVLCCAVLRRMTELVTQQVPFPAVPRHLYDQLSCRKLPLLVLLQTDRSSQQRQDPATHTCCRLSSSVVWLSLNKPKHPCTNTSVGAREYAHNKQHTRRQPL
jgi:hypothetical protein